MRSSPAAPMGPMPLVVCLLLVVAGCVTTSPSYNKREARVSFKECNLTPGEKENCGYFGIEQGECYSRGCCWGESDQDDVPWCYHSIPTLTELCVGVDEPNRLQCGYYGIRKEGCLHMECCWRPSNDPNVPWCFHEKRVPVFEGECGVPAVSPNVLDSARVVGGVEAVPHSWPWMVSLQDGSYGHFCGGSLINEQWVVSAAHCGGGGVDKVRLAEHYLGDTVGEELEVPVIKTILHPDYGGGLPDNDIMLLKLAHPVPLNDTISPVCMAEQDQEFPAGKHCYATGWGFTGGDYGIPADNPNDPDILQQVMIPLIDRERCNDPEWYDGVITENMICAGYEEGGRDTCWGDSGGPVVCYDSGRESEAWVLTGIVSWGYGCAGETKPGVYANAPKYIIWVEKTIARN